MPSLPWGFSLIAFILEMVLATLLPLYTQLLISTTMDVAFTDELSTGITLPCAVLGQ